MTLPLGACKPPEPTPTLYADLGTEESPLPPTPQAWHDATVGKGSSEWRPFRKPSENEKPGEAKPTKPKEGDAAAGADAEGEAPDAEKEIRALAAEFNAALAENKLDDAAEFLSDAQAEAAPDVFAAVNALVEQLRLLAAAASGLSEKINSLAPLLNLGDTLKMEIASVRVVDDKNATAKLAGGAEAKFVVGEKDFWYLESPTLAVLIAQRPQMAKLAKEIEETLAKGAPDEAATTALSAAMDELKMALAGKAKPESDSG